MLFGRFLEQSIKIIAIAFLLNLYLPNGLNYVCYALILGDVISEVGSFIFNYILYKFEKNKDSLDRSYNTSHTKKILRVSIPVACTSYIRSGLSTIKQLLIPYSLERSGINCLDSISKYGIINGMVMPIISFPSVFIESFSSLLVPEFSRYFAKKDFKRAKQITKFILLLTLLFCVFLNIIFFVFSEKLSYLIYKNDSISSYLKTLSFVVSFLYLDIVIDSILKGLDKQVPVMFINVIDLIVSISFIYFLVPILGVNGYIISIFLSEFLNFTLSGWVLYNELYNSN